MDLHDAVQRSDLAYFNDAGPAYDGLAGLETPRPSPALTKPKTIPSALSGTLAVPRDFAEVGMWIMDPFE